MKKIVISLVQYGELNTTFECLQSLEKIKKAELEVEIVVLNNNPDETIEIPQEKFSHLPILVFNSLVNMGFSGGHNRNISYALSNGADYVLILNNDTVVDEEFLAELYSTFKNTDDAGIVVPKIYFFPGDEFHKDRYSKTQRGKVIWYAGGNIDWRNVIGYHPGVDEVDDSRKFEEIQRVVLATGACMLVSREVLQKVGFFDERYFLYYEDADFSMRVQKENYSIYFNPNSVVWHKNARSTGGSGSGLQDYFISRNRMLFGMSYAPLRSKVALLRESLNLLNSGREWQKRGIIDFYRRKFGKGRGPVK